MVYNLILFLLSNGNISIKPFRGWIATLCGEDDEQRFFDRLIKAGGGVTQSMDEYHLLTVKDRKSFTIKTTEYIIGESLIEVKLNFYKLNKQLWDINQLKTYLISRC